MSFHAILEQVCDALGLSYMDTSPARTSDNKFQTHLSFYRAHEFNYILFEIYGSPCDRACEAKESALIHALVYFSEVLDFKIGDFNYINYLRKKNGVV